MEVEIEEETTTTKKIIKSTSDDSLRDSSEESVEDSIDDDDEEDDEEDEEEDDDDESSDDDLSDLDIKKEDSLEVKRLKIKLLKEKSRVMDAKDTIGSLVEQITAYKASVEEDKTELENKLKHEKKTKLEIFEIYKDLESERDNLGKQLELVIRECEQLEKEKQNMSKDNINNLQTLMNEITNIEESNLQLEKELDKEREDHAQLKERMVEQTKMVHHLQEMSAAMGNVSPTLAAANGGEAAVLRKQLVEAQTLLAKEREKLGNLDSLMFQARRIIGIEGATSSSAEQNSAVEINTLRGSIMDEKNLHHKTQLLLEEEKRKSDLNKKTADNLVARIKELISSHHETLQQLDDEKENSTLLSTEIDRLKDQMNNLQQQIQNVNQNNNHQQQQQQDSENSTPKIIQSPSSESVGKDDDHVDSSNNNNNNKQSTMNDETANSISALPTPPGMIVQPSPNLSSTNNNNNSGKMMQDPFVSKSANNHRVYKTIRRNQTIKFINEIGGDFPSTFDQQQTNSNSNNNNNGGIPNSTSASSISSMSSNSSVTSTNSRTNNNNTNNNNNNNNSNSTTVPTEIHLQRNNFGANFNFSSSGTVTSNQHGVLERKGSFAAGAAGTTGKRGKKLEKEIKEITKRIEKEERLKKKQAEKASKKQKDKETNNPSPKDTSRDASSTPSTLTSPTITSSTSNTSINTTPGLERDRSDSNALNTSNGSNNSGSGHNSTKELPAYLQTPEATSGEVSPNGTGRSSTVGAKDKRKSIWFFN